MIFTHTHTHTQGECHIKMEAEIGVIICRLRKAKDFWRHPKLRMMSETHPPFTTFRRNQLNQHLDFGVLASRTVRK